MQEAKRLCRLVHTVRTPSVVLLVVAAIASGCGDQAQNTAPPPAELAASDAASPGSGAGPASDTTAPPTKTAGSRPLTSPERKRLREIAASIGAAIDLFDRSVRGCPDAMWEACVDRAWAVLVIDLDWPPYYLRRLDARTRGCESLAVGVKGVNSFNLAARQLDYGDPAEVGTAIGRRDRLALVDGLRPTPSELRAAAASGCR